MSEFKVDFPPEERPTTAINTWMNIIYATILTLAMLTYIYHMDTKAFARECVLGKKGHGGHGGPPPTEEELAHPKKESWLGSLNLNWERTIFQGTTLFMWAMSAVCIGMKGVRVRSDLKLVRKDPIPQGLNMKDIPALIEVHAALMGSKKMGKSIVLTRLGRILAMWINTEDFERTAQYAKQENEMDIYVSDSSFRANRLYIWAMPLLGFVGTVYGVSYGIGGFADFLRGQVTSEEIKYQVGLITEGLAVAFYCTLLGLLTAGVAAFPSLAGEKKEEELLSELDAMVEDRLVSRMPSVRKTEFPKEDIQAMRESIDRLDINIDSDEMIAAIKEIKIEFPMEEFTEALKNVKINLPMDELTAALQNIKFNLPMEDFVRGIKDGLTDLRLNVIMPMEDLSRAIDQGFRRLPDPDKYVTVFSRAIADASGLISQKYSDFAREYEARIDQLGNQFAGKLDNVAGAIHTGHSEVAARINEQAGIMGEQFQIAAQRLSSASDEYSKRVDSASSSLAQQIARITEVAAHIDSLIKATQAAETAIAKLSASDEFGQTLSALRGHLATSDEFVQRMTRPRRIVLQEEIERS